MNYEDYYKGYLRKIDSTLEKVLPEESHQPVGLHEAMRYAIFTGGKRFRPVLTLAACEACGGSMEDALLPAVALELIHTYSLVHDDLPALDDDDMRRGKPTVHRQYGEATAILTGDALLTLAFRVLSDLRPPRRAVALLKEISTAAGTYGMIGGQAADLSVETGEIDVPTLDFINVHKTGMLIRASAVAGAIASGTGKQNYRRMLTYGEFIGLAFQSVDDLHDGDGYLRTMKPKAVREQTRDLIARAKSAVRPLGRKGEKLNRLADFLLNRMPKEIPDHVPLDTRD